MSCTPDRLPHNFAMNSVSVAVAGAGIGGLAAALALSRAGCLVRACEQTRHLAEVGAGVQLGANAVRVLDVLGLLPALLRVAAAPKHLRVHRARDSAVLACLELGERHRQRYGAPYLCLHRADLHAVLLDAAQGGAGFELQLGVRVQQLHDLPDADVVVAADGLWSALRAAVNTWEPAAQPTGHWAWRGLCAAADLPPSQRSHDVCVWLGPRLHVVRYPVRGGEWLNWVIVLQGDAPDHGRGQAQPVSRSWDQPAEPVQLEAALAACAPALRDAVAAVEGWRRWPLFDAPPLRSAQALVRGRLALLGDAAHPMRPYLAQGAGMAIEDAWVLAQCLAPGGRSAGGPGEPVESRLARYAALRWQRCAQVQARAQRNGYIFHAQGLVGWARDAALRVLGPRLLDQPWLYGGGPLPPG